MQLSIPFLTPPSINAGGAIHLPICVTSEYRLSISYVILKIIFKKYYVLRIIRYTFAYMIYVDLVFLSETLKNERKRLNINVREGARLIGISAATLSRCENENVPTLLSYAKICSWLKVRMEKFIKVKLLVY